MSAPTRLVALGASNLTRMLPSLIRSARAAAESPVEVLAALGLGRSFGVTSRLLGRALPGVDDCGLWRALDRAAPVPTTAIVMDVGNDILYGFEVPTILEWVDRALARLRPRVDRLVLAGLPSGLQGVGRFRYGLVRTVIVPGCRVVRTDALRRADAAVARRGRW